MWCYLVWNNLVSSHNTRWLYHYATQAIVRSAALGGDIYSISSPGGRPGGASQCNADAIERENLVRILVSILRLLSSPEKAPKLREKQGMTMSWRFDVDSSITPSALGRFSEPEARDGHDKVVEERRRAEIILRDIVKEAERQKLGIALASFLPPAHEDGLAGVTDVSVALRPAWTAPIGVSANVCGCIMHLQGCDNSTGVVEQVIWRLSKTVERRGVSPAFSLLGKLPRQLGNVLSTWQKYATHSAHE